MAVDPTSLTAAITAVNAAISTVGILEDSSPIVLATVYQAVQNARIPFDNAVAALDSSIDTTSVGSVVAGVPGPVLATALLAQAQDVVQQGTLVVAEAFLVRAGVNVLNAPG